MANELASRYKAGDGTEVELTPQTVAQYMLIGEQSIDQREMASVIAKCTARKLNPLAGDCYITVFRGKASIIISRDYMNVTANAMPTYRGMNSGVITQNRQTGAIEYKRGEFYMPQAEEVVGAWADVYDSRFTQPMHCEIARAEYDQHRNLWNTKPATMCLKVAEMHAQRKVYPDRFGGLYDAAEMPEREAQQTPVASVPAQPAEAARERQQRPALDDGRKTRLAALSARLASASGRDVAEVKRELWTGAGADLAAMDDAGFEAYAASVEAAIQAVAQARGAGVSAAVEYAVAGDVYADGGTEMDAAELVGEEYLGEVA